MSKSREQLISYLKGINIGGKTVLDIGAGPEDKWAKNYVTGTPKDYKAVDFADFDGLYATFDMNLEQTMEFINHRDLQSDVVFCLETLEHLWNPISALKNLEKLTKEVCYISTPFINPIHDVVDYVRYTFQWYEMVLPKFGFKKVVVRRREATSKELLMAFFNQEGMRMSKVTLQRYPKKHYFDVGYFVEAYK